MALRDDGTVAVWGYNDYGQTDVPAGLDDVIAIAAGDYHCLALPCLALRENGTVVAWGINNHWRQGEVPADLVPAQEIAAAGYHNLAIVSPALPPPGTPLAYIPKGDPWRFWDRGTEPSGTWSAENVSHQGELDPVHGMVKWGPFTDDQSRELSYELTLSGECRQCGDVLRVGLF